MVFGDANLISLGALRSLNPVRRYESGVKVNLMN